MKTLIVYASKYGCTKTCAELLKDRLQGEVVIEEASKCRQDLNRFDAIVVGGSVYMGKLRKAAIRFITKNKEILLKKRVGLFACCYTPGGTDGFFETLFPEFILKHAVCGTSVGGIMNYERMNVAYRKLFQSLKKIEGFREGFTEPSIREEAIEKLAAAISG